MVISPSLLSSWSLLPCCFVSLSRQFSWVGFPLRWCGCLPWSIIALVWVVVMLPWRGYGGGDASWARVAPSLLCDCGPGALARGVAWCAMCGAGGGSGRQEAGGHLATLSPRMVGIVVGRGSWSGLGSQHVCVSHGVGVGSPRRSQMTRRCRQFTVAGAPGDAPHVPLAQV